MREFKKHAQENPKNTCFQIWRNDNHPIILYSNYVISQKVKYIHRNPVESGLVENPEDYLYSSARNYAGKTGLLEVTILPL